MGMLIYDALVMRRIASEMLQKKRVLTLGVPTLNFSEADYQRASGDRMARFSDHRSFFYHLGFETVDSLDISDYEGANIVEDLNDASLPERIAGRYDLIYDSGTLEHVFEAPTALRSLSKITAVGGVVVHSSPANGFMDHGFWQLSPDLFRKFYSTQGFSILTSSIFVMGRFPVALPAENNIYRTRGRQYIVDNIPEALVLFAARKMRDNADSQIQLQDYYRAMHLGKTQIEKMQFFISYGSVVRARLSRNKIAYLSLIAAQRLRQILRRVAG